LLPGALGSPESVRDESHAEGLLEYPHYTRPAEFRGWRVPDVLLSGHHGEIARWRRQQAVERTRRRRPDLLAPSEPGDGHPADDSAGNTAASARPEDMASATVEGEAEGATVGGATVPVDYVQSRRAAAPAVTPATPATPAEAGTVQGEAAGILPADSAG
jgi:hypothetical protein